MDDENLIEKMRMLRFENRNAASCEEEVITDYTQLKMIADAKRKLIRAMENLKQVMDKKDHGQNSNG